MASWPVCPECRVEKHAACAGIALDEASDEIVSCGCEHALPILHKVVATWVPLRVDDLQPGASEFIGRRGVFVRQWLFERDDHPQYVGQSAWLSDDLGMPWWVPSEDLAEVEE